MTEPDASESPLSPVNIDSPAVGNREQFLQFSRQRAQDGPPRIDRGRHFASLGVTAPVVEWWATTRGHWHPPHRIVSCLFLPPQPATHETALIAEGARLADHLSITQRVIPTMPSASGGDEWLRHGAAVADEEIDSGADLLIVGDIGNRDANAAAAIIALLTQSNAAEVLGEQVVGLTDDEWVRACVEIRDAMAQGRPDRGNGTHLLSSIGTPAIGALTGFIVQAARRRTGVLIDGPAGMAAALIAHRAAIRARHWWLVTDSADDAGARKAAERLGLPPMIPLGIGFSEARGALFTAALLTAVTSMLNDPEHPLASPEGTTVRQ